MSSTRAKSAQFPVITYAGAKIAIPIYSRSSKGGNKSSMSNNHTKAVKDYIKRLKREIIGLNPSRETLKTLARQPEFHQHGINMIDPSTGEYVDYDALQPYMEATGYNVNLAMREYVRSQMRLVK